MPTPIVKIVERPGVKTAGIKVRTTMDKAGSDCLKLWEKDFGPQMARFPADPAHPNESYGVSVMVDSDSFDYWAVMPIAAGTPVPAGMDIFEIPGGLYAEYPVDSLEKLPESFTYLYMHWAPQQERYTVNMQGVGYELYTQEYLNTGALTIYCPLLEK